MTVRLAGGLAGLVCGAALAQPPAVPTPATPVNPAAHTQPTPPDTVAHDWTAEVSPGGKTADGATALPKVMAAARTALAAARDYTATMVRRERVKGVLLPEQACSLGVRTKPAAVVVTVTAPKASAGSSTSFLATRSTSMVRHRPAGSDGAMPSKTLPADDPAAMAGARHPVTGYGLAAVLDRVEAVLRTQQLQHRPTQVLVGDFTFAGKPVTRFEVFADRPTADGPRRLVLCLDAATKLPVRYEAYGTVTPTAPGGEVLEVVSFLATKLNVGLGDVVFER